MYYIENKFINRHFYISGAILNVEDDIKLS